MAKIDRSLFEAHGIGLIAVSDGGTCNVLLPAQLSRVVRPHYRRELLDLAQEHA